MKPAPRPVSGKGGAAKLGRPDHGVARNLSQGEADATGLTRGCIVYRGFDDELLLLLKNATGWKAILVDEEWVKEQLESFWGV